MSIEDRPLRRIDYQNYRFGRAAQRFRGPMPDLTKPYVSFIGGSETYGKFSLAAYPNILEKHLGVPCANWGTPGAGPWFFLKDPVLLEGLSRSQVCVVSVMGAIPNSNRLYTVHKRRNARVRNIKPQLKMLFPELEHTGYRFANNMLRKMHAANRANFRLLEVEIQEAWVARMRELLSDIETHKVLLWFSKRRPQDGSNAPFDEAPTFVTREMLDQVKDQADELIEVVVPEQSLQAARLDRVFYEDEEHAALLHPGASEHVLAADRLKTPLAAALKLRLKR